MNSSTLWLVAKARDRQLTSQCVPLFLRELARRSVPLEPLLVAFSLAPSVVDQSEATLSLAAHGPFAEACAQACADPFFGLHTARALGRGAYGLLEFVARKSPTLGEGLERLAKYSHFLGDSISISLTRPSPKQPWAQVSHRIEGAADAAGRHFNEFTLQLVIGTCTQLVPTFTVRRVWFAHPRPSGQLTELEAAFQTSQLQFGMGENGFEFNGLLLDSPLTEADPALLALLDRQAQASKPKPSDASFVALVRERIEGELSSREVLLERVATRLHMSGRTLQRRLEDLGTSFQAEVEGARRKVATTLLADKRVPISEVSYRTGYSDVRAFSRAWRRWTGESPTDARAR